MNKGPRLAVVLPGQTACCAAKRPLASLGVGVGVMACGGGTRSLTRGKFLPRKTSPTQAQLPRVFIQLLRWPPERHGFLGGAFSSHVSRVNYSETWDVGKIKSPAEQEVLQINNMVVQPENQTSSEGFSALVTRPSRNTTDTFPTDGPGGNPAPTEANESLLLTSVESGFPSQSLKAMVFHSHVKGDWKISTSPFNNDCSVLMELLLHNQWPRVLCVWWGE